MPNYSESAEKAVLVQIDFQNFQNSNDFTEFSNLALSAGANPVVSLRGAPRSPDAKYFIGKGKAAELVDIIKQNDIELVLFNHDLTPTQERNLERLLSCRVLDRTELILDIFAQRARSFEGKLQVELAQLQHLSTRLVRGWTHLERQKGGIGLRGPGETQLETDRRLIRARIKMLVKKLEKVRKQRKQARNKRIRSAISTVSLIGYTNAGKTTLFNKLTLANEYIADQLFATLDPTLRRVTIDNIGKVIFADTVGFIRELPHDLIEAFCATLEEVKEADLLLHVIDVDDINKHDNIAAVNEVLDQIEANEVPQLLVFNKIDLLKDVEPQVERDKDGCPVCVWVTAKDELGLELLKQMVAERLMIEEIHCCIRLSPGEAKIRSSLYDLRTVVSEEYADNGDSLLEINLPYSSYRELLL